MYWVSQKCCEMVWTKFLGKNFIGVFATKSKEISGMSHLKNSWVEGKNRIHPPGPYRVKNAKKIFDFNVRNGLIINLRDIAWITH